MQPPDNITQIPPTKIALEEVIDIEELRYEEDERNYRNLRSYKDLELDPGAPEIVYFANDTDKFYERMQLIDALELLITPDDADMDDVK